MGTEEGYAQGGSEQADKCGLRSKAEDAVASGKVAASPQWRLRTAAAPPAYHLWRGRLSAAPLPHPALNGTCTLTLPPALPLPCADSLPPVAAR
eukprot:366215-Chlamydomonas_euryale.AAC.4